MTKFQDHCSDTVVTLTTALESGNIKPWILPWLQGPQGRSYPRSVSTGRPYTGMNSLMLAFNGYSSPWYLTFKQVKNLGGSVRKGEKATTVFFWKWLHKEEDGEVKRIPLFKTFKVFNIEQCDVPAEELTKLEARLDRICGPVTGLTVEDAVTAAETACLDWCNAEGVQVHDTGNQACYIPSRDEINMPKVEWFKDGHKGYAQTLAHECCHATGAKSRLGRKLDGGFGSKDYAREELVAEIGSAMIMANTGTDLNEEQCVAYLKNWLDRCGEDATALNYGATRAEKAAAMILGTTEEAATPEQKEVAMA